MIRRYLIPVLLSAALTAGFCGIGEVSASKQREADKVWNTSALTETIVEWISGQVLAESPVISTRVLSLRDNGLFLDAGSSSGVVPGQIFIIYRTQHDGSGEVVSGEVQVSWTREDYSFAEPIGELDPDDVTTLHFARLVNVPPVVSMTTRTSSGDDSVMLNNLLNSLADSLSSGRQITAVVGLSGDPSWKLTLSARLEGTALGATLQDPSGQSSSSINLDLWSGAVLAARIWLDPTYIEGDSTPFANYMAPPGRRIVALEAGNVLAGPRDELVLLDGADLRIYDLSRAEPRLLTQLTVDIPPGPVRHRSDTGSISLIDLDRNGTTEVCLAPPGASRGEIWSFTEDQWVLVDFLTWPPHAADTDTGGILVAPWQVSRPSLEPFNTRWVYPLLDSEERITTIDISLTSMAVVPDSGGATPTVAGTTTDGRLMLFPPGGVGEAVPGTWGDRLEVAMYSDGPVGIVSSPWFTNDVLYIIDLYSGTVLAEFGVPDGVVIDVATGDIDGDSRAEIITAVLAEDGVRIYY